MKWFSARIALIVVGVSLLSVPMAHAYPLREASSGSLSAQQDDGPASPTDPVVTDQPTAAPTPTPTPTVVPPQPADPIVQTTITALYNRRHHRIGGFVNYTAVDGHWDGDDSECLHDRVVKLYRSRKVNGVWRDEFVMRNRTDVDGWFGWVWRNTPPSAWWNITVAKTSFSGRYGDLIVCGYAQLAQRIKT